MNVLLFSGIPFLFYFLPAVLILYFAAPRALKNPVLLLASLFFYGWGEPKYIVLMLLSILIGYVSGLVIESARGNGRTKGAKAALTLSVVLLLSVLGFFKYSDFFISNFNAATGLSLPLLRIALPIGISFYTFQILSYAVDVYRGDVPAQKNPVTLATYISLFPQLIAGPIVRYKDVARELSDRTHSLEKTAEGVRRFIVGLSKKVLIANLLGELCDTYRASTDTSVLFCWIYAAAFMLHIYFDFSGYSDMAIGLGKMFGFDFIENFNYPYISKSITEFWRRWHISLGSWFRDYVYIPLGGNRVSKAKHIRNILVVWMLTGFWHGADWNFIVWGLYFGLLLLLEKLFLAPLLQKSRVVSHIYVLLLVAVSFVIFNAPDLGTALSDISGMLGLRSLPLLSTEALYSLKSYLVVFAAAIVGATPLPKKISGRLRDGAKTGRVFAFVSPAALCVMLLCVTAFLVDGSFNPFLYFRF